MRKQWRVTVTIHYGQVAEIHARNFRTFLFAYLYMGRMKRRTNFTVELSLDWKHHEHRG